MNKRKLQINEVKKTTLRGKKQKTIATKYEVALSFFKQKDQKNNKIFVIYFEPLIVDLIEQLNNVQIAYKLQNSIKQDIQQVEAMEDHIKFQGPGLKYISKQFPIQQIMECISIKKDIKNKKISVEIIRSKLMLFFKHIRGIYPQFCFCVGEKIIVEDHDLKAFYQTFKLEWAKLYERGRIKILQKIQKLICRSLYFIGALVQNNIFQQIEQQQRKKKQQNTDLGTKSEKKRNVRGITHQVSSTYSFGSNDMLSNFSYGMKSQHSNEQQYYKSGYSEKSQKIIRKDRCLLWQKADIKNMKIKLQLDTTAQQNPQTTRFQVDLLSNDVQNILIEQAFKIQKLKDACQRNKFDMMNPYQYQAYLNMNMNMNMNMNYYHSQYYPYQQQPYLSSYQNMHMNLNQQQQQINNYQHSYMHPSSFISEDSDLYQLRRSSNLNNLVETRKTHSRLGGNKYS